MKATPMILLALAQMVACGLVATDTVAGEEVETRAEAIESDQAVTSPKSCDDPFLSRFLGRWIGTGTFDAESAPIEFQFSWALDGQFLIGTLRLYEDDGRTRLAYEGREYIRTSGAAGQYRINYFGSAGEQETILGVARDGLLHCESTYSDGRREVGDYAFEGPDHLTYRSRIVDADGNPSGSIQLRLTRASSRTPSVVPLSAG